MVRWWNVCAGIAGACLVLGCGGDLDDPHRFESIDNGGNGGDCGSIPALFESSCAASVCHSAEERAGGLDLTGNLEGQLVGVASECDGSLRVDPADPDGSFFLDKLEADPSCGDAMPLLSDLLSQAERECVRQWVRGMVGADDGNGSVNGDAGYPGDAQ
jgi:hypothetical protein